MEKSLKRTIGYIKNTEPIKKIEQPISYLKKSIDLKKDVNLASPVDLIEWIKNKDLINKSALCKSVGLNRANFDKYLKMGKFPDKIELLIINKLKEYGYTSL